MLWNGMIAPLTPMGIRGVIWYQGESNSALERAPLYKRVFSTMIEDWRHEWGIGRFPLPVCADLELQIHATEDWAELREQQLKTLVVRNTAMAVTIDIGNPDNVHPTDKVDVGLRLALAARALSYGEDVSTPGRSSARLRRRAARFACGSSTCEGADGRGGEVTGFEVAGADGKFVSAKARIEGATVVAGSADVAEPVAVRYGWANSPQCNLFNGEGLPASPFTSAE